MSIENQTEHNEERDEGEEVLPAPETGIAVVREEPKAPKEMKVEEAETLRRRARELAKQLESASGSRELEAIDSISNLGIQAQRSGASDMNLLRARVGEMMTQEGPAGTRMDPQIRRGMDEHRLQIRRFKGGDAERLRPLLEQRPDACDHRRGHRRAAHAHVPVGSARSYTIC